MPKINFYGCSFSDGGGMDRWDWFQVIKDEEWVNPRSREKILKQGDFGGFNDCLYVFKNQHKFSTVVGKKLGCDIGDYAYTANNNQNIRDEVWNNIREDDGKIHIVQWSIAERFKLWYDETGKFYRIQGNPYDQVAYEDNSGNKLSLDVYQIKDLQNFQTTRLLKHFNMQYEMRKVEMYTELLHSFAYDKGHHIYFMFHDMPNEAVVKPSANVITFDGLHLGNWTRENELTITAESKNAILEDDHYSREGNILIANKIIETLRADKVINDDEKFLNERNLI